MHEEECYAQIAIKHIRSKRDSGGMRRVSLKKKSADRATGA